MTGDGEFVDIDSLFAAGREPLLRDRPGNARRRGSLERIRAELESQKGKDHSLLLGFLDRMEPDSTLAAWEKLYYKLREADPRLSEIAKAEHALARSEIWGAMRTGADMIPHLTPMCVRFDDKRRAALGEMRSELYAVLSSVSKSINLGPEMRSYIVNFARFGSLADDEMIKLIVDELYIRRDLLEEACDICDEILKFEDFDRDKMSASRLVEDIMVMVLGGLEDRDKANRSLADRCGSLLERRSDNLCLGIRPNPDDHNTLRALSDFASSISSRKKIYPAAVLGPYIKKNYPRSHKFLGLDRASRVKKMVESRSQLATNISAYIDLQKIAAVRNLTPEGSNALAALEPMLGVLDKATTRTSVRDKWSGGIRGSQLWEYLFEMEMYLRLHTAGARPTADKKVGKNEVDLEFNGCYAEVYSPLESEILVPGHVVTVEDPGTDFVRRVMSKVQLDSVGDHETLMIVECPPGMYLNVTELGEKMQSQLGKKKQPCGVFFVRGDGAPRRNYEFMPNPHPAAPVSKSTIALVRKALDLDIASGQSDLPPA